MATKETQKFRHVCVPGGGGYVGSALVPALLEQGYRVTVLDLFLYGNYLPKHEHLTVVTGDVRDLGAVEKALVGADSVIHLACISNDPSYELDPDLSRTINYDSFRPFVRTAKDNGVKRFIFASSSSVYGIKPDQNVTEELPLEPLTDYAKYKALCEEVLIAESGPEFIPVILRPATVCGYAPRLRLDLTVNILTNHAYNNRVIKVFGGEQKRPNLHIRDMVQLYLESLLWANEKIAHRVFNAGFENFTVSQLAEKVQRVVGEGVEIVTTPSDDHRSYHISSQRLERELGFSPRYSIEDAVSELLLHFKQGEIPESLSATRYFNVEAVKEKLGAGELRAE